MKSRTLACFTVITLFAVLAMPSGLVAQNQQNTKLPHYTITDLGTVNGGFEAAAAINNRGWVADSSTLPGGNVHAFLWRKGALTDLGTLGGPNSFEFAFDGVNERGQVVGEAETSTPDPNGEDYCGFGTSLICLGFIWQNRVMTALPTLGGNNGEANGVNNRGQIVGQAETPNLDPCSPFFLQTEAVLWQDGRAQELPPFPGDSVGFASAINDQGQVVGTTGCVPSNLRAVLWQNGTVIDLGNLGGVLGNFPNSINRQGQVVGQSDPPGDTNHHAFLWTKHDGMRDLGLLPGDVNSVAASINSKTQVVGKSDDPSGNSRAFLWNNGVMTDMNTLIPASSPLYLIEALGINDRGQITGYAVVIATGEFHGFLATPCGEGDKGCQDGSGSAGQIASENGERPKIALPENLRQQLQRQRGFGGFAIEPASALKQEPRSISDSLEADHMLARPSRIGLHRGYCQIGRNTDDLSGLCVSKGSSSCSIKRSLSCPQGQEAKWGRIVGCGIANEQIVDPTRPCSF